MYTRLPFLAVLIISIFQITLYSIQNNEYGVKEFNEVLTVQVEHVTEISMTDLSGEERRTKHPKQIEAFIRYFNQFQYKRLRNDETAYMPNRTMTINFYDGDEIDFIIPYGQEIFVSHKVYSVKKSTINPDELLDMFLLLPE